MLVDCLLGNAASGGSNGVNGLHVGGGENLQSAVPGDAGSYNSTAGGTAILDVGGSALLDIKQGLHLGFGTAASSNGTLRVVRPDATVTIGGNLNLAFNEYVDGISPGTGARAGTGTLEFVITGSTRPPILVGGDAKITNGTLKLSLQGYVPPLGTSYTLLQAANVDGAFKTIDVSGAPLSGTNIWDINSTATSVVATVATPTQIIDTTPGVTLTAPINIGANRTNTDIIGAGTLTLDGAGTVGLGNNGFGHPVNVSMTGGTIAVLSGVTLRNGGWQSGIWTDNRSSLNLASDSFLDVWDGNPVRVDALTGAGTATITIPGAGNRNLTLGVNDGSGTFDGAIENATGSLSLTKEGSGIQQLTGASTYSGATTVSGGILRFTDRSPNSSSSLVLNGSGTLEFEISTDPVTFDGAHVQLGAEGGTTVSGTGTFVKSGAGILALDGQGGNHAVTFDMTGGLIDIREGTLKNGGWDGGIWGNNKASMNIASSAIFDIWNGQSVVVDALTGAGSVDSSVGGTVQTLTVGSNNGSGTFSGIFSNTTGNLGLTKIGSGTQTLTGMNTYSGTTTVSGGTLATTGNSIPDTGELVIDGGSVAVTGTEMVNTLFIGATQVSPGIYTNAQIPQITSGSIQVIDGPAATFSNWITGTFAGGATVPIAQQGPNADPDNDGIANLVEYAIAGQDPTVSNPNISSFTGGLLSFTKSTTAGSLTYSIEESTDLGITDDWTVVSGGGYVNNATTVSYQLTPGSPVKNFTRLRVTDN